MAQKQGLFAYPCEPSDIADPIRRAVKLLHEKYGLAELTSWEENDIAGKFVVQPVLEKIDAGNLVVADITKLNFNVVFEIGYTIGCKRRVYLVRNKAIRGDEELIREVGIFDTLGYREYSSSDELAGLVNGVEDLAGIPFDAEKVNAKAPAYLIMPRTKTDAEIRLQARIKKARLGFRSFDPQEQGRLPAYEAIENIAASYGVIVPLVSKDHVDEAVHNIRGAFVAG